MFKKSKNPLNLYITKTDKKNFFGEEIFELITYHWDGDIANTYYKGTRDQIKMWALKYFPNINLPFFWNLPTGDTMIFISSKDGFNVFDDVKNFQKIT